MLIDIFYSSLFIDFSTILVLILSGYYMRKCGVINEINQSFLSNLVLKIMLPCFIMSAFMVDLKPEYITSGRNIIIWSASIHAIFMIGARVFYSRNKSLSKDEQTLLMNILPIGNISFYGTAITSILYGPTGVFVATIYSIVNRIIINTYSLISMSGLKFNKKDFSKIITNASLLCSFFGALFFFTQEISPTVTINGITLSIFRFDHTMPFLFSGIRKIGNLLSTLTWVVIGSSITKESLAMAMKYKYAFIFAFQRTIITPILGVVIYIFASNVLHLSIDHQFLPATLMLLVTPTANILVLYSIKYELSPNLCIACMIYSTIACLSLFPFYDILFQYLIQSNII